MNSILNSQTSTVIQAKKHAHTGQATQPGEDAGGAASDFASLFASFMPGIKGQELADADGKALPAASGLAAEALSPTVNIITTANPATNDDSLMAFAKAQGLDEAAMAMIFQNKPAAETASDPLAAKTGQPEAIPAPAATLTTGMLALGADASMRWSIGQAGQPEQTEQAQPAAVENAVETAVATAVVTATVLKPVLFGLNGASKTMTAAITAQPAADADSPEEPKSLAASLMLGAGEAMQMAKRQQTKLVVQRVDNIDKASALVAAKSSLTEVSADSSSALPAETLILGEDLSGQDLQAILTQRTEANAQRAGHTAAGDAALGTGTDIDLRAEQYEKLSQRLGEALGQRLSAQIARGDWRVELELKPHDLGSIDVQLNMKQGELEATFKASNAMTRELINDGLARLKEVLAQSGMEVAGLNVNLGQNSRNGGNPTPGQQQKSGAVVSAKPGDSANRATAMGPATTRKAAGPDGLDVLV